ncbi:MAP/microtubule affinity-regulating kinase 4 [Psilocybe cubensis]|uniref:Protein kinase domain-containing protein n=2 Tax=Psilocybe cubensis TaxID=181762 RepID=A0A8H8CH32_PSICU|nr:MAP/microtubule affinity-regulating kinase 4 [Psilocybe cubensis]KAH9480579.1 MAP/microtubule affinity-regulating kinase 4 [Psilocybe cubensis]
MHTGDLYTASSSTAYLASNASWSHLPEHTHPRPIIVEPPCESDEDAQRSNPHRSYRAQSLDVNQKATAAILSQNSPDDAGPSARKTPSPRPASVAASPAALFLSSFHSPVVSTPKPDDEGQVISGYTLGGIIGYGSSSIIRRATSSSGAVAAVKIIRRSDLVKAGNAPQARKRLQHEAAVWASLSHEHVLPLFSTVHSTYADYFFTLYCPAGSLFDILKRDGNPALPQDDTGMMFRQVVRGLRYLHEVARYVHRDLKLENVLVDEMGVCKIGDFGMSRRIGSLEEEEGEELEQPESDHPFAENSGLHRAVSLAAPTSRRHTAVFTTHSHHLARHNTTRHRNSTSTNEPSHAFQPGSLPYAAPELLLTQTSDALRPHPSQDIWALGVMLYTLLTGSLPFSDSFEPRLQMKILNGTYQVPSGIGRGAERILQGCLDRSVASRWTIAMVDDVAWGVGWGSEGDDVTPSDTPKESITPHPPSKAHSRSRSRPGTIPIPDSSHDCTWDHNSSGGGEASPSRPSLGTASRRSASRVQRSLSRAPALTDTSSSARSASRSASRRPLDPLTADAYMPEIIAPSTSSSTASEPYSAFLDDSALDVDVDVDVDVVASPAECSPMRRGRRQSKHPFLTSRSPSSSVVPTTPPDGHLVLSPDGLEQPEEMHLDPEAAAAAASAPRGRMGMRMGKSVDSMQAGLHRGGVGRARGRRESSFGEEEEESEEWAAQDIIEPALSSNRSAAALWRSSLQRDSGAGTSVSGDKSTHGERSGTGRQRPSSSPPIAARRLKSAETSAHAHAQMQKSALEAFLKSSATPVPASMGMGMVLRSRSMETGSGRRQV